MLDDRQTIPLPKGLAAMRQDSAAAGIVGDFDPAAGALLRALAATRAGGFVLQFGSGRSEPTAWLADGAELATQLITLVSEPALLNIAKRHYGDALNVTVHDQEPLLFLRDVSANRFDLICCDELPADFAVIEAALGLLSSGGLFVVVGLASAPDRPGTDAARVAELLGFLRGSPHYWTVEMGWSTGVLIAVRRSVRTPPPRRRGRRARTAKQ